LNRPQKLTSSTKAVVWSNEQQPFGENTPFLTAAGFNASKQLMLVANGGPNYSYIVQASTNLSRTNWVSLITNSAQFAYTDLLASGFHSRFYRELGGQVSGSVGVTNNLRFPGQYFDAESGFNYNMMRDYDPTLGRYVENDPIGLAGGLNRYSYGANNPTDWIDMLGQCIGKAHVIIIAILSLNAAEPSSPYAFEPSVPAPYEHGDDSLKRREDNIL
jgi:RHS repeat-associated protein